MGDISRKEFENVGAGQYGCDILTAGTSTGNWQNAFVLADSTLVSSITGKYDSSDITDVSTALAGISLQKGEMLPSPFTSITLASGGVVLAVRAKEY